MRLRTPKHHAYWPQFFAELQRDLAVNLTLLVVLTFARLAFLFRFVNRMAAETGAGDLLAALAAGVRFDAKAAAAMTLVTLASCTLPALLTGRTGQRLRSVWASVCVASIVFLVLLRIEFFVEFNDLYNEILFIAPHEDAASVLQTAAAGNGMVGKLLFVGLAGVAAHALFRGWLPRIGRSHAGGTPWRSPASRAMAVMLVAGFFVVSFRGRLWGAIFKPQDAAVTADAFLNKAVLDDFTALRVAYVQRRKLAAESVESGPEKVRAAAQRLYGVPPPYSIEALALHHARGARIPKPRHVFIIVGESYAAWPMLEAYARLGLAEGLRGLAAEPDAAAVLPFLPASSSTMTSVAALVSGLFDVDLETNYRTQSKRPYATSLAPQFKALGYRTRFYYGGFPSWQRLADFAREQGFDDVYAAGHAGSKAGTWGVEDHVFFEAVLRDFSDEAPTLNVVLTTSNHAPFEADLAAAGIRAEDFGAAGDPATERRAHFAYADRALASFARAFRARYPESIVVVTGDHAQRLFPSAQPGLFAERAVPFVIWGPGIRPDLFPEDAAGFHLSIVPTLIELIAPAGFAYHAWASDMLEPGGVGYQRYVWVTAGAIGRTDAPQIEPLPWARSAAQERPAGVAETYEALRSIAAWRILHGEHWGGDSALRLSSATRSD